MSENGVIPRRGPREIGRMKDIDGVPIVFTINIDGTVRVQFGSFMGHTESNADLDKEAREQFMRLFMEAERQLEAAMDG